MYMLYTFLRYVSELHAILMYKKKKKTRRRAKFFFIVKSLSASIIICVFLGDILFFLLLLFSPLLTDCFRFFNSRNFYFSKLSLILVWNVVRHNGYNDELKKKKERKRECYNMIPFFGLGAWFKVSKIFVYDQMYSTCLNKQLYVNYLS